jgi:hypothetical protein
MTDVDKEGGESQEQQEQPQESQELEEKQLNSFWDIAYGGDEEEVEEVHMSQNVVTTRSASKKSSDDTPNIANPTSPTTPITKLSSSLANPTHNPSKITSSNPRTIDQTPKPSASSIPMARLEYDFLEDLKKTKVNISLFELMKIPQIQENIIKTLQGKTSIGTKEINVREKMGTTKTRYYSKNNPSNNQAATNASLTRQKSISVTPPFLINFEIFNRNVHNCMVDLGASSNVMPLKVCENINVKPEPYDIHTIPSYIKEGCLLDKKNP